MTKNKQYDKLLEFICGQFNVSESFQRNGEAGSVLVAQFQRTSGIRFGLGDAQKAAIMYLFKQGWIEPVNISNNGYVGFNTMFKPSRNGFIYIEEKRKCFLVKFWREIYESTIAGIIKGFKK